MKSMLHEASSVIKAVEKAWNESGNPSEFTIKILEKGEKNFLGISKRPAIISITYDTNVGFDRSRSKDYKPHRVIKKSYDEQVLQQSKDRGKEKMQQVKPLQQVRPLRPQKEDLRRPLQKTQLPTDLSERAVTTQTKSDLRPIKSTQVDNDIQVWNDDMVNFCSSSLKEILAILKFESSFTARINNKNLVITFDKANDFAVVDDMRAFFISIAHILMQFLKKKQKKRLKGLQIIVNTVSFNEQSNQNKSN